MPTRPVEEPAISSVPASTFAAWSRRLRDADPDAYRELFQAMHEPLLRYAWFLTRSTEASRDVVQDAFMKLWEIRSTLDPNSSLKSLLYTIVRNRALNHNRRAGRRPLTGDADAWASDGHEGAPDRQIDAQRLQDRLRYWIDGLPERRREAFELSRFEGLSHDEIAIIMNLSPSTVNRHIVMALADLRDHMRAYDPDWHC